MSDARRFTGGGLFGDAEALNNEKDMFLRLSKQENRCVLENYQRSLMTKITKSGKIAVLAREACGNVHVILKW